MSDIKLNVIYVRHMYSCANYKKTKGSFTFWLLQDPSLHCVGVEQAKLLGEDFKKSGIDIDLVCTSQMLRAIQSGIIMRDIINKDIPLHVVRHISEKGITPDNIPKKLSSISEEKAKNMNMKIDYDTSDKTNFKKFEEYVIPQILKTLIDTKKKQEYNIIVVSHSHLLNGKFNKNLNNGQMVVIQYNFTPEGMMLNQKELDVPKQLSSPYLNNQFYIYECTICEDINKYNKNNISEFLLLNNLQKKIEIERYIIKKDIYETYKFKPKRDIVDMIVVKIPSDLTNENDINNYLEKYSSYVDNNTVIAGISSKNLQKEYEDIKKDLIKMKPGCEEYNIVFLDINKK